MRRPLVILFLLLPPSFALADGGASGWGLGLNCNTKGPDGTGVLAATTGTGFVGGGTCERVPGLFTKLVVSTSNAAMRTSTVYSLHTPSVLITPPFRTVDVQPIFAVASACPVATSTLPLNWLFVQWKPTEQRDIIGSYLVGTATHTNGAITITGQYDVAGTPYHLGHVPMPGSCDKETGIYHVGSGEDDVQGDVFFTASGMGVFKTSAQRATFFFPRYQVTAATDFGGRTFRGITFDSWEGDDIAAIRNVTATANGAGTTITVEPLSDPEAYVIDGTATYYLDTLTLSSINSPADGIITGTVTRTLASSGNGSGAIACIANKTGGDVLLFCSGQSPSDNSIPYNISLYLENRHNPAAGFGARVLTISYDSNNDRAYAGGHFNSYAGRQVGKIARLAGAGLDTTFAIGTGFDHQVEATYYDGSADKLYAGGWFYEYDGASISWLARLNSNGTLDTAFTAAGGPNYAVSAIVPDVANSRLWISGGFGTYNSVSSPSLAAVNLDGSLDTSFSPGAGFNDWVNVLAWDSANSRLYVGGAFTDYDGTGRVRLARLLPTGAVDAAFTVGAGFDGEVRALTFDGSNRLYVGGSFGQYQGVSHGSFVRLASDGSYDTAFDVGTGFDGAVRAAKYDPTSGSVYVGGDFTSYNGTPVGHLVRLNLDGTIDTGFSVGTGFDNDVLSLEVEGSGKVWVGGWFGAYNGVVSARLARLNASGTLIAGTVPAQGGFGPGAVYGTALDAASGQLYAAGSFITYDGAEVNRIVRLNSDGTRDTSYATGTGFNYPVYDISLSDTGKLYAAGNFVEFNGVSAICIARLNGDGSRDTGFSDPGISDSVEKVIALSGNKVLVGGRFTHVASVPVGFIVQLNADGTRDTAFLSGSGFDGNVSALLRDPSNGKIYVGGEFTHFQGTPVGRIARLHSDGTLDTSFNTGSGFDEFVDDFALDPVTGKVFVAGGFGNYNGAPSPGIVRLFPDGTRDTAFSVGAGFASPGQVFTLAYDSSNERLIAGGYFGSYQGVTVSHFVRLKGDGSIDSSFGIGGGPDGEVFSVLLDGITGSIYVGGTSSNFDRVAANLLVRLSYSGAVE